MQDEVLVKTGDGLARDVPVGEIRRTDQQIDVDETGTGSIRGRALLDADAGGRVAFTYQGVVRLSGDTMRYLQWRDVGDPNIQRSSFITVQSYSNWPRYRWLMENQLFGFGRLQLEPGAETNRGMQAAPMSLRFSYDLYVG